MSLISDQEKIELLFKQFTGVANADKTKLCIRKSSFLLM